MLELGRVLPAPRCCRIRSPQSAAPPDLPPNRYLTGGRQGEEGAELGLACVQRGGKLGEALPLNKRLLGVALPPLPPRLGCVAPAFD